MTQRALLPGEREAWDLACDDKRWVARTHGPRWATAGGYWSNDATQAETGARGYIYEMKACLGDTIAYRARSVRADGTPVLP